ncbi:DUF342 domain-containing protein [Alkalihalobacterium elongatum]|uniref:DUF342 domain-containing protein n=1 Tax=Alkalihalobacterium elongatum TaxID=2675466 RepID=UPI001C20153E|nr:FapA family protein [Alkalihalobacterium elongatum]
MNLLDKIYEIIISKDKMKATIVQHQKFEGDIEFLLEELRAWVKGKGVVFGIKENGLQTIIQNHLQLTSPLVIAEGRKGVNGSNAYLKAMPFVGMEETNEIDIERDTVDLKSVITIPSVSQGQTVGKKVEATAGRPGMNVIGELIPAKPGKDFILRPGKNTAVSKDKLSLIAQVDGQPCIDKRTIHVYPGYEVYGDLDMKTGNIDFIGNVTIRGNVPSGFEVKAKGDIRVQGTVESATLVSEGSIYVGAGIAGQGKGIVKANKDIFSTFINQGNVEAGGNLHVHQSILHSNCHASGSIYCNKGKGNIVGGQLSAGSMIIAKEVGNSMHTPTELIIGVHQQILKKIPETKQELKKAKDDLEKLRKLLHAFDLKEKQGLVLQANERILKLRVKNTLIQTEEKKVAAEEELRDMSEEIEQSHSGIVKVERQLLPNVTLTFGKYRRKISVKHQNVKVAIIESEIKISPL